MNVELIRVVSDIWHLILDWTFRIIPTEEEFVDKLKGINTRLAEELKKPQIKTIQAK